MKRIYFAIVVISCLFLSCEKDSDDTSLDTIRMNDKEYVFNMPQISIDIVEIKTYLDREEISYTDSRKNDFKIIVADLAKSDNELFKKAIYTYKYLENKIEYFNVKFEYNGVTPSEEVKKYVNSKIRDMYILGLDK